MARGVWGVSTHLSIFSAPHAPYDKGIIIGEHNYGYNLDD